MQPHPIPAWTIAGSRLTIAGVGDSWHSAFTVSFALPALGNVPAGNHLAFTTTPNMFFDVDAAHGSPCHNERRNIGYTMTLFRAA